MKNASTFPKEIRRTRQRISVWNCLVKASTPLTAVDIYNQLQNEKSAACLSTVYRILELFVSQGIVSKSMVLNTQTAAYEISHLRHRHYAVCIACHRMIPIKNCPLEAIPPCLDDEEFHITGHNMQLFGYCKNCSPKF